MLRNRQLQLQGKYEDAMAAYDAVLSVKASGDFGESQTQEAAIGRTYCLVGTNKARDALKILQDTIAKADDDDTILLARPYSALGNCYRALNDNQQALWAVSCAWTCNTRAFPNRMPRRWRTWKCCRGAATAPTAPATRTIISWPTIRSAAGANGARHIDPDFSYQPEALVKEVGARRPPAVFLRLGIRRYSFASAFRLVCDAATK